VGAPPVLVVPCSAAAGPDGRSGLGAARRRHHEAAGLRVTADLRVATHSHLPFGSFVSLSILVPLVGIHRPFITRCYRRECPAAGLSHCIASPTLRLPGSSWRPSSALQARGGVNHHRIPFCGTPSTVGVRLECGAKTVNLCNISRHREIPRRRAEAQRPPAFGHERDGLRRGSPLTYRATLRTLRRPLPLPRGAIDH
jgi:hypothetical protein